MTKRARRDDPIETLLKEGRRFPPPREFVRRAAVRSAAVYRAAAKNPVAFWEREARRLRWMKPWRRALSWRLPDARWFVGGRLNASDNCLDRHVEGPRRNKAAILWEGEPGDRRVLTYWELWQEVNRLAAALSHHGVRKGDTVTIYMPMIPEIAVAMLACARIGAPHSVVFGGFSPEALRDRINDARSRVVLTADGGYRRGAIVPLKKNVDEALAGCPGVATVVVCKRTGHEISWSPGRDVWWNEFARSGGRVEPEPMDAEDMLFLLYTSGSTGRPKGIVHTTGGYLAGATATSRMIFDLRDEDVFWCTADCGWVTGHSYVVYGPLCNGATCVMYEGTPDWPDKDRWWRIVERYGVTILYTAPTAIRTFVRWGTEFPGRCDLSSLRLLGTVGEPINPEAWVWYWKFIGRGRCPVVDTWWQTETGHILISPLPGVTVCKPGSATRAFPGVVADVVNDRGESVEAGYLVIRNPWPGMLRGIHGDKRRYREQYWSRVPGVYFTGDGAKRDRDGYLWLLGRIDDVMNVAGHRISTMEVESALVDHEEVAEAAVIGRAHETKGQAIAAFVTLKAGVQPGDGLAGRLKDHVVRRIGALARPEEVLFAAELPKTRSGKIMRRLLRDIAEGRALGDTTTLADPNAVAALKERYEERE
jgi:acetyl-CoA synthetase